MPVRDVVRRSVTQELEAQNHLERQKICDVRDRLRLQELDQQREAALIHRAQRMHDETARCPAAAEPRMLSCVRQVQEQLEMRETALAGLREHYERKVADDVRKSAECCRRSAILTQLQHATEAGRAVQCQGLRHISLLGILTLSSCGTWTSVNARRADRWRW